MNDVINWLPEPPSSPTSVASVTSEATHQRKLPASLDECIKSARVNASRANYHRRKVNDVIAKFNEVINELSELLD